MLLDITGKEVTVGDVLAISPSHRRHLFKATVVGTVEETRQGYLYNRETRRSELGDYTVTLLRLRLHSNGRVIREEDRDLYKATAIIGREEVQE